MHSARDSAPLRSAPFLASDPRFKAISKFEFKPRDDDLPFPEDDCLSTTGYLVNSDPEKNYFRVNYYNGLSKAYLRKEIAIKLSEA
jgi:hypothetical protein